MPDDVVIRNMTRVEVDALVEWAAREGWNPGRHDAATFRATDPEAFIAAELDGELVGGGAITSYGGEFGFMGLFIVRPEFRGRGLGNRLWRARRDRLLGRLRAGATIGLDGVFAMQDYYASGGFVFSHRNMRFRADGPPPAPAGGPGSEDKEDKEEILPLSAVPFAEVAEYDRTCFPAPRTSFLTAWISQPDALALGCRRDGRLSGFGVARRCREGCKIGPLFADDRSAADGLFARLREFADGGPVFLDAPENNPAAMDLVRDHRMAEVFGCARMYLGAPPGVRHDRVFGVTTLELG